MTISSTLRKAGPFTGNGVVTLFPFAFKVFAKTDIELTRTDANGAVTTLVLDSDYSVTLNVNQDSTPGGTIAYPITGSPLPAGATLIGIGDLPYTQPTDITNNGGFYPSVVEDMSDRSTIQIQQLAELSTRTLHFPVSEDNVAGEFPTAGTRAETMFGFDANGNPTYLPIPASVGAGDLRNEAWTAGIDYTAGTSTSVQLSRAYGSKANLGTVVMAGVAQDPNTYSIGANNNLQFDSVIPVGVTRIWCVGGTTISLFTPPAGSVGDTQLQWGAVLNRTVDSITALRNLSRLVYSRAFATGYYAPHDGGGGAYQLDGTDTTSADNGGTVIVASDGGRWKLQCVTVVSVQQFGALPSQTATVTTAAFNCAAKWGAAQASGAVIRIPAGNYSLNGAITWNGAAAQLSWLGDGSNQTVLAWASANDGFYGGAATPVAKASFRGMTLVQNAVATGCAAIRVNGAGSTPLSFEAQDITAYGGSVGGTPSAGYWGSGAIYLLNPTYPRMTDVYHFGIGGATSIANNALITAGITIVATNGKGSFLVNLKNCFCNSSTYGFYFSSQAQPGIEGVFMDSCNAVSVTTGCRIESTVSTYWPPQYVLSKCQFEVATFGVSANHVSEITLADTLIYDDGTLHSTTNAVVATDCIDTVVHDCHWEARPGNAAMSGVTINGASTRARVHGNVSTTPGFAVVAADTASGVKAFNNDQYGAGGIFANISSSNSNWGNATVAPIGKHWFGSGVQEKYGTSVVTTDASGNFTVAFDEAFPNNHFMTAAVNGDTGVSTLPVVMTDSQRTLSGFGGRFVGAAGVLTVRVNWISRGN